MEATRDCEIHKIKLSCLYKKYKNVLLNQIRLCFLGSYLDVRMHN